MKMKLSEELKWRGFVQQTTLSDLSELDKKRWVFYHGFDASADSQTVGNLAAMMLDRVFLRHGHEAILLAGGATSLIGDPGGKDKERPAQDEKTIAQNILVAEKQLKRLFKGFDFKLVNNLAWLKNIGVLEFLRDVGKHFSMTPLVQRDYIAARIGENKAGISYAEFSYTLLQGYDYQYLFDRYNCTLQLGGSDQWGNCLSGVELIRRTRGAEVHAITLPLIINQATGKKFGKTEDGAIWLDEAKTSTYRFYQFWLNVDDEGVESYLKIFTELDKNTLDSIMKEFEHERGARLAQKTLAYEATKLVHGEASAKSVKAASEVLFGEGSFLELSVEQKRILKQELPVHRSKNEIVEALVASGLASSKTEARTFISSGAVSVNGQKVTPQTERPFERGDNLLRRGKNKFAIVSIK